MPKVSVLMPVYNASLYLFQAIESILLQTFQDWELILIDDGSTDDIMSTLGRYKDERIYYVKNETNMGLIKTLNRGIDYCKGDFIARMDADDISHPRRFEFQVDFMNQHPEYLMCGTNASVIDNNGQIKGTIQNLSSNDFLQINLLFSPPFVHPSVMIRREVLAKNRYDENYKHVEDYELWCRIAHLGKIANIDKDLLSYRWHDKNVSVLNSKLQDTLKDSIVTRELRRLDLVPTTEELYYHRLTFNLYHFGNKTGIEANHFYEVSIWFSKVLEQNERKKIYNQTDLTAFLWARWIILCLSQKKFEKALSPTFRSFKIPVLKRLLELILFLRKKR